MQLFAGSSCPACCRKECFSVCSLNRRLSAEVGTGMGGSAGSHGHGLPLELNVLVSFDCQLDTASSHLRRESQLRYISLACGPCLWCIFLIVNWYNRVSLAQVGLFCSVGPLSWAV